MSAYQPAHPAANKWASNAPSRKETAADPEKTLQWISDRLAEIYSVPTVKTQDIDRTAYLSIYSAVWAYCNVTIDAGRRQYPVDGQDLYSILERAIQAYCQGSLAYITATKPAAGTLSAYVEQWAAFLHLSGLVAHLFQPLESHWIRREVAEAARHSSQVQVRVRHIPELHITIWRERVVGDCPEILNALEEMGKSWGTPGDHDKEIFNSVKASLGKVGLVLRDGSLVVVDQ